MGENKFKDGLNIRFDVQEDMENKILSIDTYRMEQHLSHQILDMKEKIARDFLIKLGWTPPDQKNS
jgi:hypothetical protein